MRRLKKYLDFLEKTDILKVRKFNTGKAIR